MYNILLQTEESYRWNNILSISYLMQKGAQIIGILPTNSPSRLWFFSRPVVDFYSMLIIFTKVVTFIRFWYLQIVFFTLKCMKLIYRLIRYNKSLLKPCINPGSSSPISVKLIWDIKKFLRYFMNLEKHLFPYLIANLFFLNERILVKRSIINAMLWCKENGKKIFIC